MVNFYNLEIYKKSLELAKDTYEVLSKFPKEELFGITSQIKRAVVSVFSNIAEGSVKGSNIEFARFLGMSIGSLAEAESQLTFSLLMNYISKEDYDRITQDLIILRKRIITYKKKIYENK